MTFAALFGVPVYRPCGFRPDEIERSRKIVWRHRCENDWNRNAGTVGDTLSCKYNRTRDVKKKRTTKRFGNVLTEKSARARKHRYRTTFRIGRVTIGMPCECHVDERADIKIVRRSAHATFVTSSKCVRDKTIVCRNVTQ